ncbi:MAG: thiamine-phosphate diphosphorylase, partial [Polaromonas sp. 39-63-203]
MNSTSFVPLIAPIGFYPVVPTADWVQRLLGWGVRTIQLRAKAADHSAQVLEREVRAAVDAGRAVPG